VDLIDRPPSANGGLVHFRAGRRSFTVNHRRGETFSVPTGQATVVRARDRFHNFAKDGLRVGD
jgi:hypothetical protein